MIKQQTEINNINTLETSFHIENLELEKKETLIGNLPNILSNDMHRTTFITSISNDKDLHPLFDISEGTEKNVLKIDKDSYKIQFKSKDREEINSIYIQNQHVDKDELRKESEMWEKMMMMYWIFASKIMIINIHEQPNEDDKRLLEQLISIKHAMISPTSENNEKVDEQQKWKYSSSFSSSFSSPILYILVHNVYFQNQNQVKEDIQEAFGDILKSLEQYFDLQIIYLAPTLIKKNTPKEKINQTEISPLYLFSLHTLMNEILLFSTLVNINKGSGENGNMLSCFINRLTDFFRIKVQLYEINIKYFWLSASRDLLTTAINQCVSKYKGKMECFVSNNKCSSLKTLMKRHNQVFEDHIIPHFLQLVKYIPDDYMHLIELGISILLIELFVFEMDDKKIKIKGGAFNDILQRNIQNSILSSSEIVTKHKENIINNNGEFDYLDFENDKKKMGSSYFSNYLSLIDFSSSSSSSKNTSTQQQCKQSKSTKDIHSIKRQQIKDEKSKKYLGFSMGVRLFNDLSFSLVHEFYSQHYSILLSTFEQRNAHSNKYPFLKCDDDDDDHDNKKEYEMIKKFKENRDNLIKLITPKKIEKQTKYSIATTTTTDLTSPLPLSKQPKLYIPDVNFASFEYLENKNLVPRRFENAKLLVFTSKKSPLVILEIVEKSQSSSDSNISLQRIKPYQVIDERKHRILLIVNNNDDNSRFFNQVHCVSTKNQNGSFSLELIFKYKTDTGMPLASNFTLMDKNIQGVTIKKKDYYQNTINFLGDVPKERNLMLVASMTIGNSQFQIPIFIH